MTTIDSCTTSFCQFPLSPIQYQTYAVDHFRQRARSKLDRTDPNPAHRMGRSLDDLTIHKGMRWNPRLNPDLKEGNMRFSRNGMSKVPKSATIHSFTSFHSKSPPPSIKQASQTPITERTTIENSSPGSQLNTDAFSEEDIEEELSIHDRTQSPGIVDVEVASSETETTVYLVHLLSLQSRRRSSSEGMIKMPSIEETESEETDSIDEYDGSSSEEAVPEPVTSYTLPHPVPSLAVYDENDSLVETVVKVAGRLTSASRTDSATHDDANRGDTSDSTSADKGLDTDSLSNGELERSSV